LITVLVALLAVLPFGDMQWRSIGPAIAGGRVAAVSGTSADPFLYYFGAMDGGVWKTSDGGSTWTDVWGQKPVAAIGALAIAPSKASVVWVGTGEANPRNDTSYGDGVWVTTDGAKTWTHRGLDTTFAISRILVSRGDPNTVLAGALGDPYRDSPDRGVYRTMDGGRHWKKTLYVGPQSGISDMAADPSGRTVFAGVWQFRRVPWSFASGGPADGLYRSRDGGVTWQHLQGHGLAAGLTGRIGVAVAPSNPRVVYAVVQSRSGVLWRSDDGGSNWRLVNADTYVNQRPFYMSHIAVDPMNPNHVMALSEDLVESRDGGANFVIVPGAVHQDHHDLWWSADGRRLIEANDGSAAISVDGGSVWLWRFNVPIGQVYHVGYDVRLPYHVCGGMQDNDSFCGPSDSLDPLGILDTQWRDVGNDGDGSWVWPDPGDPNLIWNVGVSALNGQLGIYDLRSGQNYDVTPNLQDTNGVALAGNTYRFDWQAPVAFSAVGAPAAFYGGNVVFKSVDRGRTWTVISPDLTLNDAAHQQAAGGPINTDVSGAEFFDTILDIAPSPVNAGVIWVGTDDGLVQLTVDGGLHWKNVTMKGIGAYGRVETVEPSHVRASSAFAVVDRHFTGDRRPYIFSTDDFGVSWHSLSGGLPPDEYAHVVRQDPRDPNLLYAGLEQSIWVTFDAGRRWSHLQQNMPTSSVADLRIQPKANDLVAATHGRGFFILDDLAPLQSLSAARSAGAYFFQARPAYLFWRSWTNGYGTGAGECCAPSDRFAGRNPDPGALLSYYLAKPVLRPASIEILDASGSIVRTLTGPNRPGINRVSWNLTESPPEPWRSAREWNQGPADGAAVVPGTYTLRLRAGDRALEQTLVVKADPRATWTQADLMARRDFVRGLLAQLNDIDKALNDLDGRAMARKLSPVEHELYSALTSNPRNSEDDLLRPDRLRERLQTLLLDIALSQGPPTPAQREEAGQITNTFDGLIAQYRALRS
jgi:photosystem II stability/assembly factor-like uncharacterized protein